MTSMLKKTPLKEIVVKAVLDALRIKHQSGASGRTFEDVLEYGKKLFFLSLNEDVDVEVLTTLWPKSWNDVKLLLKEQGYEDVKEFLVCFCFEEKESQKMEKLQRKLSTMAHTASWIANKENVLTVVMQVT